MKKFIIIILALSIISCNRKIASTNDFIIYPYLMSQTDLTQASHKIQLNHIYATGEKWITRNIEGKLYKIPTPCLKTDLDSFFHEKTLAGENSAAQNKWNQNMDYTQQKLSDSTKVELTDSLSPKLISKVIQFSFLKFIDQHRVVFVSDNLVRYNKTDHPVIKPDKLALELGIKNANGFQRGYYMFQGNNTLIVELRQFKKDNSKWLYFNLKNNNLELYKITTFKFDHKDTSSSKKQIVDLELDLKDFLPNIEALPLAFNVDKKITLLLNNEEIDKIEYKKNILKRMPKDPENQRTYKSKGKDIQEDLTKEGVLSW